MDLLEITLPGNKIIKPKSLGEKLLYYIYNLDWRYHFPFLDPYFSIVPKCSLPKN
jgi:hypothetical protein